jgi:RNA-splicing ligase RtcB
VPLEDALECGQLPFALKWIAAMSDVYWGIGATVRTDAGGDARFGRADIPST